MITLTIESLIVSILLERENLKLVLVDEYFVSENDTYVDRESDGGLLWWISCKRPSGELKKQLTSVNHKFLIIILIILIIILILILILIILIIIIIIIIGTRIFLYICSCVDNYYRY